MTGVQTCALPISLQGLFPATLFDGVPLFSEGKEPSKEERATYLEQIWTPYHQTLQRELARLKAEFGYALLFDAHSIRSVIPHLFDGKLPDFNLGTFNGDACDPGLASQLEAICAAHPQYSHVLNGRFKGGHITRHHSLNTGALLSLVSTVHVSPGAGT